MNGYRAVEIYEETKDMTPEQRKERLRKIVDAAQKEFGFECIANAKEKSDSALS